MSVFVRKCRKLKSLEIINRSLDTAWFEHLSDLECLSELKLDRCTLISNTLTLPYLGKLDIRSIENDDAVEKIAEMIFENPQLKEVKVSAEFRGAVLLQKYSSIIKYVDHRALSKEDADEDYVFQGMQALWCQHE